MKTDVYSWRVSPARKAALEEAARVERTSVAKVLDRATDEWIRIRERSGGGDELEQARLRRAALRFFVALHGSDPDRSREARLRVRAKLARRHAG
jgi:hypothetical protein